MALIDLNTPEHWPGPLQVFLRQHMQLYADWERRTGTVGAGEHDAAVRALATVLKPHTLRGWHCTRLTDAEIGIILRDGMVLPDRALLGRRIDAVCAAGLLDTSLSAKLKARNQAGDVNRRGKVWFCFYPPVHAGEDGIHRFFRHWGGEALYNSHEQDRETAPVLARIGRPCLVEAEVPIAALRLDSLMDLVVWKHLHSHGIDVGRNIEVGKHVRFEGYAVVPLPQAQVQRIISFPDPEFARLTGCATWHRPLEDTR